MSTDFRASQIRTSRIIASGSTTTPAALLIYGHDQDGEPPLRGNIAGTFETDAIGPDTFLYVSGTENRRAVFGGGLTLSRSVIAHQGLPLGQNLIDSVYQQGLFEDWTASTTVGFAIAEINNVLKGLAPSKPPYLTTVNSNQSGQPGKLVIDATYPMVGYRANPNKTVDQLYSSAVVASTTSLGVFGSGTAFTGYLASNVSTGPGTPYPNYVAKAFQKGDTGTLTMYLNGTNVRQINLATAGAVNDAGTGFILSATQSVVFSTTGIEFTSFKYRTGTWQVAAASQTKGFNNLRIVHDLGGGVSYETNQIDWFIDADEIAPVISGEVITNISLTGTKNLSGVKYNTGGTFNYNLTGSNEYSGATYSPNSITHAVSYGLQSVASTAIPNAIGDHTKKITATKAVAFQTSGIRLVNGSTTITTTIPTVLLGSTTSAGTSLSGLLIDNVAASNTTTTENFTDESYRLPSDSDFTSTLLDTGLWVSTNSLTASGLVGYNDGLLVGEGKLKVGSTNYSVITNGPAGNPDYSTGMGVGNRTFHRLFSNGSTAAANFTILFQGVGVSFISTDTAFSDATQMKVEYTAPTQTGWLDAYKDFLTGQFATGNGGRAASYGIGRALNTTWGLTIGTKNIVGSGYKVYLRLTVPYNFSGYLTNIAWTFLT